MITFEPQLSYMASIKYRLKAKEGKAVSIYIRLSLGRGKEYETKTGFNVKPMDWSLNTHLPKTNSTENKQLNIDLKHLESFILGKVNKDSASTVLIDTNWLKNAITECFGRVEKTDEGLLLNHINYIIDTSSNRKIAGGKIGLAKRTVMGYVTFKNLITRFQKSVGKQVHFLEIDKKFVEGFTNWLFQAGLGTNYVGKNLDKLGAVCRDAKSLGIEVNPYIDLIKGFTEKDEDRHIVTLSFDELELIENAQFESKALENAKKWLLIGCAIGQRGGDLLNLCIDDFRYLEGNLCLDIIQQKTKKAVTVPILSQGVVKIIENEMPHSISEQKLNKYIKEVCKAVGINELTTGKKIDPEMKTRVLGEYPKCELVASHCFRRSFATNYYKHIPTPILMQITGHSRESTFLQYINKRSDKDENAKLFAKYFNEMNAKKEPKLRIVKQA